MEFFTDSLKEVVSKLNENQKEEIFVIEAIVGISENNKEETVEKIIEYMEKHVPNKCFMFIFGIIEFSSTINPKQRKAHMYLFNSI